MSAIISADGLYRYRLIRDLGMGNGSCCFIMLNPSTADATQDDPTIRRCVGFARQFGAARLEVVNLFAYRATDPAELRKLSKEAAIGPENDTHLFDVAKAARFIVCAWGNHGALHGRGADISRRLYEKLLKPQALHVSKTGQPGHPLYLPSNSTLMELKP